MIEKIIVGEKLIKEENTERGIEQFRIRVDSKALWLEHWLITNGDEKLLGEAECDWVWTWNRLNMNTLPR